MSDQNKKGVNPTTSQPQNVKSFGEHKTPQGTKKTHTNQYVDCTTIAEALMMFQKLAVKATKDAMLCRQYTDWQLKMMMPIVHQAKPIPTYQ